MMRSMYAAISGLKVHQTMLDVTSNDIANVNTLGYKAQRTTFKESLSQLQRGAAAPNAAQGGSNAIQIGLGVQLGSIDNNMSTGALQTTGNPLDVALQGDGSWFRVASANPAAAGGAITNIQYTRSGNFTRNEQGYLVTPVGQDGAVSYDPSGGGARVTAGYLSLASFANEAGLQRVSSNRWSASNSSGPEVVGTPGGNYSLVAPGQVEMSNVDLAQEFTNMISAQRGFQANSRVISTADQMLQDLVNLSR
jgi:flagellar hook protein FlgE